MKKRIPRAQSPLIKFLREAFNAIHEHFEFLKAQRNIETLEYSVDFVISLMRKAAQGNLKVTFTNVQGITLVFESLGKEQVKASDPTSEKFYADYMKGKL